MSKVSLITDGTIHHGWKDVSISLGLDRLAGDFSLTLTETWPDDDASLVVQPIPVGCPAVVKIDDDVVITGYLDAVDRSYDQQDHTVSARGRDKTGDLVDCCPDPQEFVSQTAGAIVSALCKPFGIKVHVMGDVGAPFGRFVINPGDTVADAIERVCRQRALICWSSGRGSVFLGKAVKYKTVAVLQRGVNVKSARGGISVEECHSEYTLLAQAEGKGKGSKGKAKHKIQKGKKGLAKGDGINRHRPLILVAETQGHSDTLQERAEWEARVRAARGVSVEIEVYGWRTKGDEGLLWMPGHTVSFADEWLMVEGDWLISAVTFKKSDSEGTISTLTLMPPDAFDRLPEEDKNGKKRKGGKLVTDINELREADERK